MKTKGFIVAIALLWGGISLKAQEKKEVDTQKSIIEWQGKKVGGKHTGLIQLESGFLELVDDKIISGSFVADMTSITNTDLTNDGINQKLVGHLKSDDFFGVETYSQARFDLTQSTKFADGTATLTGDITIKGKTESISFEVLREDDQYTAKVELDRSKFDVRYGSKSFFNNLGDKAINDIFTLDIKLVVI